MKKKRVSSLTTRFVVFIGAVLFVTNIVLGTVLMRQSTSAFRTLIRNNMLALANTAAELLDGDALGALTEEDVGSERCNDVLNKLKAFQSNIDIEYIYSVRQVGEDEFVFTVDADPENPAEFGEPVLVTDALRQAAKGIAAVDAEPAQDEWGNFYSAYSPVYDSTGQIAGIVGLDFNSEWYDSQIRENTKSIGILSVLFVVTGEVMVLVITRRMRKRFSSLGEDLSVLSSEMDELMGLISANTDAPEEAKRGTDAGDSDQRVSDELEELGKKIQSMQQEMQHYLSYVHAQAYTDALTQVGNATAYVAAKQRLEERFGDPACAFGIAVFDINLLKLVNDRYGHTAGDRIIRGAANAISDAFGPKHTYRIGGDEFVAVVEGVTEEDLEKRLNQVDRCVQNFNKGQEVLLSLSKGVSVYLPETDNSFQDVFARADQTMYEQKEAFHRQLKEPYRRY